jgi:acetyltransferase EpsM
MSQRFEAFVCVRDREMERSTPPITTSKTVERVAIYGAGGLARGFLQIVRALATNGTTIECVGFIVDDGFRIVPSVHGIAVFSGTGMLAEDKGVTVVIGIGSSAVRHRIARHIESEFGPRFASIIHPQVVLDASITLGQGNTLFPGLLAGTDISIGSHVYTHHHVHLGHDSMLGDARIGEGAELGLGATVLPNIRVGSWSRVGAGAVVTKDVPENATVAGVPARVISRREI